MHARRYFVKALDAGDQRAALPLAAYKRLYKIEDEIRDLDDDAKRAARQARSKPVWDELAAWCALRKQREWRQLLLPANDNYSCRSATG
jgi:hypothetical protein